MRQYVWRVFCAFVLLKVAQGLVKDAEKLLKQTAETHEMPEVIEGQETESQNGNLPPVNAVVGIEGTGGY